MSKFHLSSSEKETLESLHRKTQERKKADKIKTLLFLDRGFTYIETAELLMLDRDTIARIRKRFKKDWIEKFLNTDYVHYSWKLSLEEEKQVSTFVENHYIWDSKEIIEYIKTSFWKTYSISWINALLHRLWFSYKKTKQVPAKADKAKQEKFLAEYEELKKNKKENEIILFADWVHPLHNSQNWYCWIKTWTEKELKSNTWRDRVNINGVFCVDTQEATIVESEMINAQSTVDLYKKIEEKYADMEKIYIVRDNARYYNCTLVKKYLENSRIIEIPLPPYSPNLNAIERLWKFFKKQVTSNKYYEKFDDFKKAILHFFNEGILLCKEKLRTAVTDNFSPIWV